MESLRSENWGSQTPYRVNLMKGALVGFLAALPMSLGLGVMVRMLPASQRYPLPPREITLVMAEKAGLEEKIDEEPVTTAAVSVGHFGYSALSGAVYAAVTSSWRMPAVIKGLLFSSLLWAGSYLGWIPALNILKPANEHPRQRTLMMIVAHWIWGVSTALGVQALSRKFEA